MKLDGTDAGTVAVEATTKWEISPKDMIKGKFLRKKINAIEGSSNSLENILGQDDNIFKELIDLMKALTA